MLCPPVRMCVWACLVNGDDWARGLAHYIVGLSLRDLWDGGYGPKPKVPTMPPFSWLGRSFFAGREKSTFGTCLMWESVGC